MPNHVYEIKKNFKSTLIMKTQIKETNEVPSNFVCFFH